MATLALIGSGRIGGLLARFAVDGGLDVVVSNSRGPETLSGLVADLGPRARAATAREAAEAGDLVVVTIPFHAYHHIPKEPLAGKVVIDTGNYYPARDGVHPELVSGETTSSELLQAQLDASHVVKAFNNIYSGHLAALPRPVGAPDRSVLPIAGDDPDAKKQAAELISVLGYDTLDAGPLAEGWRFDPGTPLFGMPYGDVPAAHFQSRPAAPTPAATISAGLAVARR
ncbi:NADPH-dependent F420 reductase [Actinacidiphila sp. ITFR-21]|uniref:NADPH-dependent F420 reductase n=1 Tax=Actinacidiphila sp. ITFR-21 TaxID=3075199 RepID=UPI00288927F0|nr:NAD(P)-binding domain-containing protein [Streptomyces sp. ITFR-21]WNI16443.1 NAD(P)-binding domain-containing protein [Streptomyces sp. ITFR-21]